MHAALVRKDAVAPLRTPPAGTAGRERPGHHHGGLKSKGLFPSFPDRLPAPWWGTQAAHTWAGSEFLTALVKRRLRVTFNLI